MIEHLERLEDLIIDLTERVASLEDHVFNFDEEMDEEEESDEDDDLSVDV